MILLNIRKSKLQYQAQIDLDCLNQMFRDTWKNFPELKNAQNISLSTDRTLIDRYFNDKYDMNK